MSRTSSQGNPPASERTDAIRYKSKAQQRRELLQLRARYLLTDTEYYLYRFHERDKDYSYMLNFMTTHAQRNKFRHVLNDPQWAHILDNKWLFYLHYKQFAIPLPEVYGIYERGSGFTKTAARLAEPEHLATFFADIKPSALVIKPVGGRKGQQVLVFDEIGYEGAEIRAVLNTGQTYTFSQLIDALEAPTATGYYLKGGYLLQEKVQQHEFLKKIAPYTTNTIRVVTFLDHNHHVAIHFTVLRLGRQGSIADNFDRGGIAVAIDPKTGVLGEGVTKAKYGGGWVQTHPDSGVKFSGQQLPYWDDILACCTRAAQVSPKVRSIGWDIALTPSGPVVLEGNENWDLQLVQVHTQGFLQPEVREELARFGLTFPEGTLPRMNPREWWVRLRERYHDHRMQKLSH